MLEMCLKEGYEIPAGIPSMQNLQSAPPPPLPPMDSPTQDQHHDSDLASAQLHAQQAQYDGQDDDAEMGGAGQGGDGDGDGAPTAPMQNIAQQAMDHGGEHRRPDSATGPPLASHYGPIPSAHPDTSKIDPAVTGA